MNIEFNWSEHDYLIGVHLMGYEDEFGNEGLSLQFGFLLFSITVYL